MPLFLIIRLFAIEQTGRMRTNYRLAVSVNPLDSQAGKVLWASGQQESSMDSRDRAIHRNYRGKTECILIQKVIMQKAS